MTVYVDNFRAPATVGRIRGRWSHLTADTVEELHAFAEKIGMQRSWFQGRCKTKCAPEGQPCPHWHYDVVDALRTAAIAAGAQAIDLYQMGDLIRARRLAATHSGELSQTSNEGETRPAVDTYETQTGDTE